MPYTPPKNRFEVLQRIEFEEALEPADPRYVETSAARGSVNTLKRLAAKFGLDLTGQSFYPPSKKHVLFFGHIGCGKSTELRRYAHELAGAQRFYVVVIIGLVFYTHDIQRKMRVGYGSGFNAIQYIEL